MNIVKKYFDIIIRMISSPNSYAKRQGVKFGKNCHFRTKYFGSEPYLITLGDNVTTSVDVIFITHDGAVQVLRTLDTKYKRIDLISPIIIGNNVFLGWNAIIMPGTKIGNNVIVGAGSLVRGELSDNSVYAGVPARYICSISEYIEKNEKRFYQTKNLDSADKKKFLLECFKLPMQGNV